jgi:hypothetical protein
MITSIGIVSQQPSVLLGQVIGWKPWPCQTKSIFCNNVKIIVLKSIEKTWFAIHTFKKLCSPIPNALPPSYQSKIANCLI